MIRKLLVAAVTVWMVGVVQAIRLVGNDADEYGCRPSAGQVWCEAVASCLPMNEVCPQGN